MQNSTQILLRRHVLRNLFLALVAATLLSMSGVQLIAQESEKVEPTAGQQVELSFKTSDEAKVDYLLYLPKDYEAGGDKKFPLMYFLHGRGESKGPLSLVAKWGPPKMAAAGQDMPFILVSPQCPVEDYWNSEDQLTRLTELLAHVTANHSVDETKISLTGLSMGGYGSWALAAMHPKKFAAVVPVCGGGKPEFAEKIKDIPIWVWHGDQDSAVPFKLAVEMVDEIKKAGGESVQFTSLEGIGHNCWSAAYSTPQLFEWMLKQTLETETE